MAPVTAPLAAARSQLTFARPYLDNDLVELAYRRPGSCPASAGRRRLRLIRAPNPRLGQRSRPTGLAPTAGGTVTCGGVRRGDVQARLLRQGGSAGRALAARRNCALHSRRLDYSGCTSSSLTDGGFARSSRRTCAEAMSDPTAHALPYWNRARFLRGATSTSMERRNHRREIARF